MNHSEQVGEQHDAAEDDQQLSPSSGWEEIDFFFGSQDGGECLGHLYSNMPEKLEVGSPS